MGMKSINTLALAFTTKAAGEEKEGIKYTSSNEVFSLFKQLNQVARPSWHEQKAAEFLTQFATRHGLDYTIDAHHCVVIRKPATPGHEHAPAIVLLNHMDMVCVSEEGKQFDPLNDPIESYIDNGWIKARGTSLGADNGIGLCMALAVLQSKEIVHGPMECIFTTNEEDGMTGAVALSPDALHGRLIINLDSEDYDLVTVGSAAAYLQITTLPFSRMAVQDGDIYFRLTLKGGRGGHSGVDINKGRANANKLIGEFLHKANQAYGVRLAEFNGGEANNSIATSAEVTVGVAAADSLRFEQEFKHFAETQKALFKETDPALAFALNKISAPKTIITQKAADGLLRGLHDTLYGVLKMSETIEGAVETSHNVGVVKTMADAISVSNFSRSFVDAQSVEVGMRVKALYDEAGQTEVIMSSPGWQSDLGSALLQQTDESFMAVLGFTPKKVAMHFALESGLFIQKFPGCQIVSIGPKIIEPHSITERVDMETIDNIWKVLIHMLYQLAAK